MSVGKGLGERILVFLELGEYCDGYQKSCVTLYIHILVFHVLDCKKDNNNIK